MTEENRAELIERALNMSIQLAERDSIQHLSVTFCVDNLNVALGLSKELLLISNNYKEIVEDKLNRVKKRLEEVIKSPKVNTTKGHTAQAYASDLIKKTDSILNYCNGECPVDVLPEIGAPSKTTQNFIDEYTNTKLTASVRFEQSVAKLTQNCLPIDRYHGFYLATSSIIIAQAANKLKGTDINLRTGLETAFSNAAYILNATDRMGKIKDDAELAGLEAIYTVSKAIRTLG